MIKLKSYSDFFKDVEAEGEFKCFDYSDEVKKEIIDDYRKVFAYERMELLSYFIDEVVETARLLEVRIFPKNELMYIRAEVRFRGSKGRLGKPYHLLTLWDCFHDLKSYTFIRGEAKKMRYPTEILRRTDEILFLTEWRAFHE